MPKEYSIIYTAQNKYENWVENAQWQFLIIPQENATQEYVLTEFSNSIGAPDEFSINGYGFKTIRVHPKKKFKEISFTANFKLIKKEFNPFDFERVEDIRIAYDKLKKLDFKVTNEPFLKKTRFTSLPEKKQPLYSFDLNKSLFQNVLELNSWTYEYIHFKTGVTNVNTTLKTILKKKEGVCQDFTHLFCAIAKQNGLPARYVSGYLHQGNGLFGDSQMHAWAEIYFPGMGWLGFDPTNNLLANENHIKVAHGKDYQDCSPLKGVVYTDGKNETTHAVKVSSAQQQQ